MSKDYYPPTYLKDNFHCVRCIVYAKQYWSTIKADGPRYHPASVNSFPVKILSVAAQFNEDLPNEYVVSKCSHCNDYTVWYKKQIIFPRQVIVERPNEDLSEEVKSLYDEAALILNDSPRASAALLRLALQVLCEELGEKGNNINDDIKSLVKKGLDPRVQKAMDALRVVGNNGAHPGEINLNEERDKVVKMFSFINFIAQKMITEPKELEGFFDDLPEKAKKAIEKRDGKGE